MSSGSSPADFVSACWSVLVIPLRLRISSLRQAGFLLCSAACICLGQSHLPAACTSPTSFCLAVSPSSHFLATRVSHFCFPSRSPSRPSCARHQSLNILVLALLASSPEDISSLSPVSNLSHCARYYLLRLLLRHSHRPNPLVATPDRTADVISRVRLVRPDHYLRSRPSSSFLPFVPLSLAILKWGGSTRLVGTWIVVSAATLGDLCVQIPRLSLPRQAILPA